MKSTLLALAAVFAASSAGAAPNYGVLAGNWDGKITTNLKDTTGGGNPTASPTGAPVTISFAAKGTGVAGTTTIGTDKEMWQIDKDEYSWNDGTMTVTSKAISYNEVPEWVRKQANLKQTDTFFAFKFSKCTINKTNTACAVGKDLPDGIQNTGIWIFRTDKDQLQSNVYYNYSNGGKRILEESLARKK